MRLSVLLAGVTVCSLMSCTSTMSVRDLSRVMAEHSQESKNNLYYRGSDSEFDYFVADRHMSDQRIKLPKGELKIDKRFGVVEDSRYWVRLNSFYPHGVHTPRKMPTMMDDGLGPIDLAL